MIGLTSRCAEEMGTAGIVFMSEEPLRLPSWLSYSSLTTLFTTLALGKFLVPFERCFSIPKVDFQVVNHGVFCGAEGEKGNKQLLRQIQNTVAENNRFS